jgi:hypothetical protein
MTTWRVSLDEVLGLMSIDYWTPVIDAIDLVDISGEFHQKLKERMLKDGINKVPILIEGHYYDGQEFMTLANGHHRTRIAYDAGWLEMIATDDDKTSGYGPNEKTIV